MISENTHTEKDILSEKISKFLASGTPFCVCRFPGKTTWEVFTQREVEERNERYFIIQPWGDSNPVRLYAESVNSFAERHIAYTAENVLHDLPLHTPFEKYADQFASYISAFENGSLKKVILSRIKCVEKPRNFNALNFFRKLDKAYPGAMVYLVSHPTTGMWMGATPEILLEKTVAGWQTVSLAGTLPAREDVNWTRKEKTEQEYVSAHIRNSLALSGIQAFEESSPANLRAGTVKHLKSTFHFEGPATPEFFNILIKNLHPTPAVAGLPAKEAAEFVNRTELHSRGLYTGYLGIVNFPERVSLFVNLRCMQIGKTDLALYLGGGITSDSDLQSEWDETEQKSMTLLQHLND